MKVKLHVVSELIENGTKYTIYRDEKNNKFYKYNSNSIEMIQPSEYPFYQMVDSLNENIVFDKKVKVIEEKSKKAAKITYNVLTALLCVGLLGYGIHKFTLNYGPKVTYVNSEKTTNDVMDLFINTIDANKTINEEYKSELLNYLSMYVNECNNMNIMENDSFYLTIADEISKLNVKDVNQVSLEELVNILAIPNGKFIASELYYYDKPIRKESPINFYIYLNKEMKKAILEGNKIKINTGTNSYLLDLDDFSKNDDDLIEYLKKWMESIIGDKFLDRKYHKFLTNIFSPYIEDYTSDGVSYYYELQDNMIVEITSQVYYMKLMDLVYTEGLEVDYNNKKYRELLYLYAEALRLNFGYQWTDNVAEYIYESIGNNDILIPNIGKHQLMRYLNGEELDITKFANLGDICIWGEETLGLIQELNKCFKIEVEEGYLSEERYNNFLSYVENIIEDLYPDKLEEFQRANETNNSMENYKIELVPNKTL